jgi:O-antigen/teichoic acid export membrane protein
MIILNHVYTPRDVAIYAIALQFPTQLKVAFSVFGQALAPKIYEAETIEVAWHAIRRQFWELTIVASVTGVIGFLLLPPLMTLLFTDRYSEAAEYGRWLWLTTALFGSTTYLGSALLTTKQPAYLYIPNIGYPLVLIALYVLLIPYGVSGLIIARMVAIVAMASYFVGGFLFCLSRTRPRVA